MNKRILSMILAAAMVLTLAACAGTQSSDTLDGGTGSSLPEAATFTALVLEESDSSIMVRPDENSNETKSADQISVSLKDATLTDVNGDAIEIADLNQGDTVEITYDGYILETYPAMINSCTAVQRTAYGSASESEVLDNTAQDPFNIEAGEMPDPESYAEAYSQPDFTEAAGFALSELPELGEDITYDRDYLINGEVAELCFTIEDNFKMFLRIAVDKGQGDISGVVGEFEEDITDEQDGITMRTRASAAGPAVMNWSKNGYLFSIYFPHNTMSMAGGVTQMFLEGLKLLPETAPAA